MLFPTNIVVSSNNYPISEKEIQFAEEHSKLTYENAGNTTSLNRKILGEPEMQGVMEFIQEAVDYYVNTIINPKDDLKFYITQSWLNYTKPNQYHHKHAHANSIVSGVFYINAEKNIDRITFYKDRYSRILIEPKEHNFYNSSSWWFPVETGQVILFDSSLEHMVEMTQSSTTRVSLAFNVFCKGKIGDNDSLTELEI
jgi:uncharacterized protein (TIGR02466 family)